MFNFLKFANNKKDDIDLLLIYVFISFLFGIVIFFILSHIKAKIIEKKQSIVKEIADKVSESSSVIL